MTDPMPVSCCTSRAQEKVPTIFQEEWWLDAASGGRWERVDVGVGSGARAWLPFTRERIHGAVQLAMPPYTRTLGPSFSMPPSKPVTRIDSMRSLVGEMIRRLPRHDLFRQVLPPGAHEEALAFALNGWTVGTEYTFCIGAATSPHEPWGAMSQKTRNLVRTAGRYYEVEWHREIGRLVALSRSQLEAKRATNHHRYAAMSRAFEAARARGCAAVASALDDRRREAAAVALVWDANAVYLWNTARNPAESGSGALSLLVWEACKMAHARGLTMDLDGFASPAAGRFVASFGGTPTPRPVVTRKGVRSSVISLVGDLRRLARRWMPP